MLGGDVDAAGDVVEQQDPRLGQQPAADQHLLLVAAGERADGLRPSAGGAHLRVASTMRRPGWRSAARRQEADAREPAQDGERQVVAHAHRQQQALGLAVLRHQRDAEPGPDRVARAADARGLPSTRELAAGRALGAEQREEQLALALAGEAADAEDLALVQAERDVVQRAAAQSPSTSQRRRASRRRRARRDRAPRARGRSSG